MPTFRRLLSLAKFPAVVFAPFLVAIGSWHLALLAPGRFRTEDWRTLALTSCLLAGMLAILMLAGTSLGRVAKIALAVVIALVFLYFAFLFSLRSHCGDEQLYIGQATQEQQVASCR